ncbi:hypothetical protein BaRGS_00034296 [Batillaria attramentaria]|uniref:Uncharacterized protein n=1 Tax=Batillaria attramentaria TaxID=370345 RepID=A0ABD0JHT6_9CAEN
MSDPCKSSQRVEVYPPATCCGGSWQQFPMRLFQNFAGKWLGLQDLLFSSKSPPRDASVPNEKLAARHSKNTLLYCLLSVPLVNSASVPCPNEHPKQALCSQRVS